MSTDVGLAILWIPLMDAPSTSVSLLGRLRADARDSKAWARFVVVYGPVVVIWCRDYGLQDADTHDVAQDVLIRFSKTIGRFEYDPSKRFRGWLRSLVHSSWYEWVTSKRQWHSVQGGDLSYASLMDLPARDDLVTRLEAAYDLELLQTAMARVRDRVEPHTWQSFYLLAVEQIPGKEAAERLGLNLHTAYSARSKVQRMIREEMARIDRD